MTRKEGADRLAQRLTKQADGVKVDLKAALDRLYEASDLSVIEPDPLQLVLRYQDPHDQEVSGFLASCFAYGRAELIVRHAGQALDLMGPSPAAFVDAAASGDIARLGVFRGFKHRLHRDGDWASLCLFVGGLRLKHESMAKAFAGLWRSQGKELRSVLSRLHESFHGSACREQIERARLGLGFGDQQHLIPDAAKGSACKRLNLFLRWMVRKDKIDPGPFRELCPGQGILPSDLVIPVDTHIARVSASLGLTGLRTPGWRMAAGITRSLAAFDPEDPVRYDFGLCRLGILEICPRRKDRKRCEECPIMRWCRL